VPALLSRLISTFRKRQSARTRSEMSSDYIVRRSLVVRHRDTPGPHRGKARNSLSGSDTAVQLPRPQHSTLVRRASRLASPSTAAICHRRITRQGE